MRRLGHLQRGPVSHPRPPPRSQTPEGQRYGPHLQQPGEDHRDADVGGHPCRLSDLAERDPQQRDAENQTLSQDHQIILTISLNLFQNLVAPVKFSIQVVRKNSSQILKGFIWVKRNCKKYFLGQPFEAAA